MNYEQFKNQTAQSLQSELSRNLEGFLKGPWLGTTSGKHDPPPERNDLFPIELIWSYWLEEGGLVQGMHAISLRFQNKAVGPYQPLARFDISPLRPISEILWGYVQDESFRLSLRRRAYEYLHQYGLRLIGKAVGNLTPADNRSRFLQAFHELLNTCIRFYRQRDDLTVQEDPWPVLNKLKSLHMVLAEGAHNQYGDLPFQARLEMRVIQRILDMPELREFLGGRIMMPYPAEWMDRVDTLRKMMRWGDASITDFYNLATAGELILLTVRNGPFGPTATDREIARAFAVGLRDQIVQYVNSYQAVTGVDLGADTGGRAVDATQPSVYLNAREVRHRRAL